MRSLSRPQSHRSGTQRRGMDVLATRGQSVRARDQLKSGTGNLPAAKPAARRDQFGSRHNEDLLKQSQRRQGRPMPGGGRRDPAFRESAQDVAPNRGERNKLPGRRRRLRKSRKSPK